MHTMIGPNPNTTANAKTELWNAARAGKASARNAVNRLKKRDEWTADMALDLLAGYDRAMEASAVGTPDRYRWAAARSYVVAAASTFLPTEE
jgi:hypothetical protein